MRGVKRSKADPVRTPFPKIAHRASVALPGKTLCGLTIDAFASPAHVVEVHPAPGDECLTCRQVVAWGRP